MIFKNLKYERSINNLAILAGIISLVLYSSHLSFEKGYQASYNGPSVDSTTIYVNLTRFYLHIVLLVFTYFVGRTIKIAFLSQTICFVSLIWAVKVYIKIYEQKSVFFYDGGSNNEAFSSLMLQTIPLDAVIFTIVSLLLIYQIITALQYWFYKSRNAL